MRRKTHPYPRVSSRLEFIRLHGQNACIVRELKTEMTNTRRPDFSVDTSLDSINQTAVTSTPSFSAPEDGSAPRYRPWTPMTISTLRTSARVVLVAQHPQSHSVVLLWHTSKPLVRASLALAYAPVSAAD